MTASSTLRSTLALALVASACTIQQQREKLTVIGIAKKLEEIYFPEDPVPLFINKKSESLKLIQQLRNEAHRFGITFHRDKRSKEMIKSELDQIKGLGEKSRTKLLTEFGSVKRIKEAKNEELIILVGKSITTKLRAFLTSQTKLTLKKLSIRKII